MFSRPLHAIWLFLYVFVYLKVSPTMLSHAVPSGPDISTRGSQHSMPAEVTQLA
jgi:hypothetical protein